MYAPLFAKLTPEASEKVRKGNYERLFDEARRSVRAWEKANVRSERGGDRDETTRGRPADGMAARWPRCWSRRGLARGSTAAGPAGARADADARAAPRRRTAPPRPRPSRGSTSTASPCSTWATRREQNDPDWFDVLRPTKLPAFENEFGEDGHFFAGVRQSRLGVKGFIPTDVGRAQDHLRVRAVRHRRRRRPDDVPPAPRLGRAGPVRRRPDLEPVHGHRRLPELGRVLGPERHGVLPQRAGALDAVVRTATRASRSRSSGRARAPTRATSPAASSSQDVKGRFPLPDLSGALPHGRRLGPRPGRRHRAPDEVGRPARRRVRPVAATPRLGHQPQLEPQVRRSTWPRLSVVYGEGIQNYMNDAPVDVGIENNFVEPAHARSWARRCRCSASSRSSTSTGTTKWTSTVGYSMHRHRQQRRPGGRRVQEGPVRARQPPVLPGPERDARAARSSGASARTSATASPRTTSASSSRSSTTSSSRWEASDERIEDGPRRLRLLAAAAGRARRSAAPAAQAQTPAEIQAALDAAYAKYKDLKEGKNADYIPALAKVDSNIYGIALVTADGKVYTAGDIKSEVSIQSISKVFTMAKVIEEQGPDAIAKHDRRRRDRHALQLDRRDRVLAEASAGRR